MNPVLIDPDIKVNMSLDEIIKLTKGRFNGQLQGSHLNPIKKKKRNTKRKISANVSDHSVPLLSTPRGVEIYVSKNSPLLSVENRRRIAQAVTNRVINSDLIEKSKEIIPAEYKLVRTNTGVERVLVPAFEYFLKPTLLTKNLSPPRKLNKIGETSNTEVQTSLQDKPPPLVAAPIYEPPDQQMMEIDSSDDEIIVLHHSNCKTMNLVDIKSESLQSAIDAKELCIQALNSVPQTTVTTLNDRFSMLGNY